MTPVIYFDLALPTHYLAEILRYQNVFTFPFEGNDAGNGFYT